MNNLPTQYKPEQILEDYWQGRDNVQPLGNNLPANFDGYGTPPTIYNAGKSSVDFGKVGVAVGVLGGGAAVVAVGIAAIKATMLAITATITANAGTATLVFFGFAALFSLIAAARSGGETAKRTEGNPTYQQNVTVNIFNGQNQQQL